MKNPRQKVNNTHERVMFTLPTRVLAHVKRYARLVRDGNTSGFVADAIEAYITHLRKERHTRKLRDAYAAAARDSRVIAEAWDPLSDEMWAKLEKLEDHV